MIACHEAHSKTLPLLGNSPPSNSPRQLLPQPGNPTHPPLLGAAIEMLPLLGNLVLVRSGNRDAAIAWQPHSGSGNRDAAIVW